MGSAPDRGIPEVCRAGSICLAIRVMDELGSSVRAHCIRSLILQIPTANCIQIGFIGIETGAVSMLKGDEDFPPVPMPMCLRWPEYIDKDTKTRCRKRRHTPTTGAKCRGVQGAPKHEQYNSTNGGRTHWWKIASKAAADQLVSAVPSGFLLQRDIISLKEQFTLLRWMVSDVRRVREIVREAQCSSLHVPRSFDNHFVDLRLQLVVRYLVYQLVKIDTG